MTRHSASPPGDLTVVRRAGRIVAIQASVALTAVLTVVGAVVTIGFLRAQSSQITDQLTTVAMNADDVDDPPPGMELAMRSTSGSVTASDGGKAALPLLSEPAGFSDLNDKDRHYRALTVDRPEGRVVAITDLAPYRTSQSRLFGALALAELTGIVASIAVVMLFTRRSVQPLAQALALQRRFVADASHELRAPLTVLHTRAQLLATRLHSGDVGAATRDADAMVSDTRALSAVVDDLLASATMATETLGGERVDVAALSHAVCTSMGPHADSVGVALVCDVRDPDALEVIGTEAALRRALTALVDNAISHQNDGGRVELVASRDGQQVIVSVADNGVGIDDATMATLFNRFSHGTNHTNRAGRPSYGIGLALVREIIQGHGGEISVKSAPGRGATFTVALPAAPAPR